MENKKNGGDIPRPKEDVRIEKDKPKFNSALSNLMNKPTQSTNKEQPNKKDEST